MLLTPRSLFVHIPKTGGAWVTDAIVATGTPVFGLDHHIPPDDMLRVVPDRLSFTFVRHPVTWWRSLWVHARTYGFPTPADPFYRIITCPLGLSYAEFMTRALNDIPGEYSRVVGRYADGVKEVGRTEHLEDDLRAILARAGEPPLPAGRPPRNVGRYDELAASAPEIDREIIRAESMVLDRFYGGQ